MADVDAPPGPAAAPAATLRVVKCPEASLRGREFALGEEDVTLGRDASNTIALGDPDVSRQHARIVRTGRSHVLVDMESTNGTSVNGRRVSEVTLRPGDRVLLGSTALVYQV
jgi:pSer/pThr/pTyr-binding forkhead associated (FHA) protein